MDNFELRGSSLGWVSGSRSGPCLGSSLGGFWARSGSASGPLGSLYGVTKARPLFWFWAKVITIARGFLGVWANVMTKDYQYFGHWANVTPLMVLHLSLYAILPITIVTSAQLRASSARPLARPLALALVSSARARLALTPRPPALGPPRPLSLTKTLF